MNKYNGWSSYETWLVATNLHNNPEDSALLINSTADQIKQYITEGVEEAMLNVDSFFVTELAESSLNRVDWNELEESLKEKNNE